MPPVVLERPKMSRAMWEALKSHIMKERQRKKQELEADAEVERQRKERERQLKQDSMTLSETREQISVLDSRLTTLKDEKHQLFMQLKKVLHEDDTRRRQLLSKESEMLSVHSYMPQPGLQLSAGAPPQMMFQPVMARPQLYTVPRLAHASPHGHQTLIAPVNRFDQPIKRSRTPSPPPPQYRFGPFKPPPQAIHPYPPKPPMPMQYYHTPPSQSPQQAPPQSQQHHVSVSYQPAPHPQTPPQPHQTIYAYPGAPPSRSPQGREEQKHVPTGLYLHHGQPLPRAYVVHQQMDHPSQSPKFEDNQKYYAPPSHSLPIRGPTHMSLHPGLTIQAPQVKGGQSGGITSGYPIRTTPSVSSYQGRPPSPHVVYAGQSGPGKLQYGHGPPQHGPPAGSPHGQHSHQQQVTISRYSIPPGLQRD